ncbi:MAG: hypothetical protein ACP5RW_04330 [bacterium]
MQEELKIPQVEISGVKVSRFICGTNPFNGYSHFSKARDIFMQRYFTVDKVLEVLEKCQELGINSLIGPINEKTCLVQEELIRRGRPPMVWVSTTLGWLDKELLKKETKIAAEVGNKLHAIHCSFVDSHLVSSKNEIEDIEDLLKYIRDLGMIPGISTHRPETLTVLANSNYDIEFVILPFNSIGFLSNLEVNWIAKMIREFPKPIIAIKPLAAGRLMPEQGIPFVAENIKPNDTIAIGVMSPEEVEEDVAIFLDTLQKQHNKRELLNTPSKSTVTL